MAAGYGAEKPPLAAPVESVASTGGVAVDNEQIEQFLSTCMEMMTSDAMRKKLKEPSSGRPGKVIVEMQQGVWDKLGIPKDAGREAVNRLKDTASADLADLLALKIKFAKTADAVYLQCLEDRRPSTLKRKGKLPRNSLLEFFDACTVKLELPDVQQLLVDQIKETGSMPEAALNKVHDDVMELVGWNKETGQRCIKEFGQSGEYQNDREVAMGYARWRGKASEVCLTLLNTFRKEGGELNVGPEVRQKLYELEAREGLDKMSAEERAEVLKKNVPRLKVIHSLPGEARNRYLDKLKEEDRLEIVQCDILVATVYQHEQQNAE